MPNLARVLQTLKEHPKFVLMRTIARFDRVRYVAVRAQCTLREPLNKYLARLQQKRTEFFGDANPVALAEAVERDGLAFGLELSATVVEELLDFARSTPCWVDRDPRFGFFPEHIEEARLKLGRRFLVAYYFNVLRRSAVVGKLATDRVLLEVAARYLGTAPKLVGVNMWWSYPEQGDPASRDRAAQMFHFDLDDFKFIKFFFYLTNVDESAGPHVAVRATHRDKRGIHPGDAFRVRRYSDEEVLAMYGRDRVVSITGPAGTGFIEDTLCIHKGEPPTKSDRLVLQLQYALNDFGIQTDDIDESKLAMIV